MFCGVAGVRGRSTEAGVSGWEWRLEVCGWTFYKG